MKKILGLLKATPRLFVYFCVATIIGQTVLLFVLKSKRTLSGEKVEKVLAVFYGVADYPIVDPRDDDGNIEVETASLADIEKQRTLKQLNATLRENAIDKGNASLTFLIQRLEEDRTRFRAIRDSLDAQVKQKEKAAINAGLRQLQRSLQSLPAKHAKGTLQKMIEDGEMSDVINILVAMPNDKRKSVLAEFKSEDDQTLLYDILKEMLTGNVELIENAQKRMNAEFNSKRN